MQYAGDWNPKMVSGKWRRGELVEPKKQIIYYIDPATPKQWRSHLIAGINDWQVAFEKLVFKMQSLEKNGQKTILL